MNEHANLMSNPFAGEHTAWASQRFAERTGMDWNTLTVVPLADRIEVWAAPQRGVLGKLADWLAGKPSRKILVEVHWRR